MRTPLKLTIARTIAIAGITSAIVFVAGAWLLVQHQRYLTFVRSQGGWDVATWMGKTLVFKVQK